MTEKQQSTDEARVKEATQQQVNLVIGDYQIGKTLGKGTFGKVKEGIHLITGEKVAVKVIEKQSIQDQDDKCRINRQVEILRMSRHPNIIHLYEIIQTTSQIYIFMEFSEKGQLFHLMTSEVRIKQRTAGRIFIQIMNAVQYLHRLGIAHRDLKPQNILLDTQYNIKLIDFGLSNYKEEGKLLHTACGSPCYAPPQMVAGNPYDGFCGDVWSMGIIFYAMICGSLPFEEKTTKELYQKIIQGFFVIPNDISMAAIEVIQAMLVTDPKKRITLQNLRKLKFFTQLKDVQPQIIGIIVGHHPMPIDSEILERMKNVLVFDKGDVQSHIKQNHHNKYTATYYLTQKKALREGNRTVLDLQVFLETHQKYSKDYGHKSIDKKRNHLIKSERSHYNSKQHYDRSAPKEKLTPIKKDNTPLKRPIFSNDKLQKRFNTTQQFKPNLSLTKRQRNETSRGLQKQDNSPKLKIKKSRDTQRKNRTSNLAKGIWQAYFQKPIQKSKEKKDKQKDLNIKEQQNVKLFHNNIKKLKEGFMRLPKMKKN